MKIPTEGNLCWDFFLGGALVSSAPTEQKCTIYFVGAAETAAPPGRHQPRKHCTNRANHKRLCWGAWWMCQNSIIGLSCSGKRQSRAQPVFDHIISFTGQQYFVTNIL